jgi:adenylate kinase
MIGLIFGPPGSGKGTQAARIHSELDLEHLSTGEILRAEAARGTEIGKEAARLMKEGHLVPDELLVPIIRARLQERRGRSRGVLLDGFPRTVEQAKALDELLAADGRKVDFVVALDAPDDLLIQRLLHRAVVEHRPDDTEEAIKERMKEYHERTAPVLEHYRRSGVPVAEIDAIGSPDEVFERIHHALQPPAVRK